MDLPVWKILCIDSTPSESDITKLLLEKMSFLNRAVQVIKASAIQKAEEILQKTHDIAVILIDMEEDKAKGLTFIRNVREQYQNHRVRIILRTGYPDTLPSRQEIADYTIDGYIPKEIMSETQIEITVMTAIRAYHQIITTETQLSSLAGSIAHEMRNPLAQIHGNLYLIEELQKQAPYLYSAKPTIAKHIKNAQRVIQSGLQVIDITMDAIADNPVNTDNFQLLSAQALVEEAVTDYAYEEAEHASLVSVSGEDFKLIAEPVMVKYVLYNLIQNALWYVKTLPDAKIVITLKPTNNGLNQIEVRDTGPGIAPEALAKLFDSFYTSGKQGGTGLGLSYCKRTMTALGGDISCESELDQYTAFTLCFPLVSAQQQVAFARRRQPQKAGQVKEAGPEPLSLVAKTVLVAEDDNLSRGIIKAIVEKQGIRCLEAENGQVALDLLAAQACDLIFTDIQMPLMDGLELIERVRKQQIRAATTDTLIPIIAVTAVKEKVVNTALQAGACDYLSKPVTPEKLAPKLQQWLAS